MTFEEWYRSVDDDCGFDDCKIRDVAAMAWFAAVENIKDTAERSEAGTSLPKSLNNKSQND